MKSAVVHFSEEHVEIIRFCAIECELQRSGERSVWAMINAWQYAAERSRVEPTVDDVIHLGKLVEPSQNSDGFRRIGVRVGNDIKPTWQLVPRQIEVLVAAWRDLTAEEWFKRYEEVHPFRDGNGRSGAILFNWRRGSLDAPVWPPNFWDDPRRIKGAGA